jgi:hypothetical protein
VLSLTVIAFQVVIVYAARWCALCEVLEEAMVSIPILWLDFGVLLALAVISVFVGVLTAVASLKSHSCFRLFLMDILFAMAIPTALFLIWIARADRHESWVLGFSIGLIVISLLWTTTFLLTRRQSANCRLRTVVYCLGALVVVVLPMVVTSTYDVEFIRSLGLDDRHVIASARCAFAALFSSLCWSIDVLL